MRNKHNDPSAAGATSVTIRRTLAATPHAPLIDTSTRVETPEHIAFEFRLAGPWRRGLAYAVDLALRVAALGVLAVILIFASALAPIEDLASAPMALLTLAYFVTEWFYFVLFEWLWGGLTPGKKGAGLRVVKDDGLPIGLRDALLRNLLRAADLFPLFLFFPSYLVGVVVSGADSRFRRLGDLVAGTMVVVEEPTSLHKPALVEPPPLASELALIPVHLRLKIEEKKTLDAFLRRWKTLHPARREELCHDYAMHLAKRLGVPPPKSGARFLQLVYVRLSEASVSVRRRP